MLRTNQICTQKKKFFYTKNAKISIQYKDLILFFLYYPATTYPKKHNDSILKLSQRALNYQIF